jgi:hypothetical protein
MTHSQQQGPIPWLRLAQREPSSQARLSLIIVVRTAAACRKQPEGIEGLAEGV